MIFDRYDILSAYYLFGSLYHLGHHSKEYSYISRAMKAGFSPGVVFGYNSLTDNGKAIYSELVARQAFKRQTAAPLDKQEKKDWNKKHQCRAGICFPKRG